MSKLRLSYSLVSTWMKGKKDEAIELYLHMNDKETIAMRRGRDFDRYVEEVASVEKCLPAELGGKQLTNPCCKYTLVVPIDERMDLKVEMDIWDEPTIIEIKNSVARDSADFSNDLQLSFYFLAAELSNIKAEKAELYRFDPTTHKYDMSIVWKSHRRLQEAVDAINQYGPEIYQYFQEQGIL